MDFSARKIPTCYVTARISYYINRFKNIQRKIRLFVENNFEFEYKQFTENKIFFRNQQSVLHYYSNTLSPYDRVKNIENNSLEIIYGNNYSIYKLK